MVRVDAGGVLLATPPLEDDAEALWADLGGFAALGVFADFRGRNCLGAVFWRFAADWLVVVVIMVMLSPALRFVAVGRAMLVIAIGAMVEKLYGL